jgi:hypothetical protein
MQERKVGREGGRESLGEEIVLQRLGEGDSVLLRQLVVPQSVALLLAAIGPR